MISSSRTSPWIIFVGSGTIFLSTNQIRVRISQLCAGALATFLLTVHFPLILGLLLALGLGKIRSMSRYNFPGPTKDPGRHPLHFCLAISESPYIFTCLSFCRWWGMCCCWVIDRLSLGLMSGLVSLALTSQSCTHPSLQIVVYSSLYLYLQFLLCWLCPRVMTNKSSWIPKDVVIHSSQPCLVFHESLQEQTNRKDVSAEKFSSLKLFFMFSSRTLTILIRLDGLNKFFSHKHWKCSDYQA